MGSALNSVMGGSGGGLLGAVGGIVGGMFGGPIGAMIGQAIGNMLQEAIGDALKQAATQLHKEDGMPKFLTDLVHQKTDQIVSELKDNSVPGDVQQHVQEQYGSAFKDFTHQLAQSIVEQVRHELKNQSGSSEESGRSGKGGKSSGGSWMQAIAESMGKVMGKKAADMVKLSKEIADLTDKSGGKNVSDADKMKMASETQTLNAKFQATSQEFNLLQTTFSTTIKTLGEGMASIARKQ